MKSFDEQNEQKKGINKTFVVALIVAVLLAAGIIWATTLMPATDQTKAEVFENAIRKGDPKFEELTKKVIIFNNADRMTQSRTGLGTILMNLTGTIKNITGKTITGLEIEVGMVDSKNKKIKGKTLVIIPKEIESLESGETREITASIDGFQKDDDRANAYWKVTAIRVE